MKRPAAASAAGKKVSKKPAVRAKAEVMKSSMKAPKKSVSKKPSTKTMAVGIKNATWKNVHSKIWHTVRTEVFRKTGDEDKAKTAASAACARAKVKFLKGTLKV